MPFQHFPKEIEISKNARISVPTTRVFGKYPRVRQICPQMEKLIFLEIWKLNLGSAKATNHCGTFIWASADGSIIGVIWVPHGHNRHNGDSQSQSIIYPIRNRLMHNFRDLGPSGHIFSNSRIQAIMIHSIRKYPQKCKNR